MHEENIEETYYKRWNYSAPQGKGQTFRRTRDWKL